jgi:putative transposase
MPRQSCLDFPGSLHHIMTRGIERKDIFTNKDDYSDFLERLGKILLETNTKCYAWSLMNNHFRLLLQSSDSKITKVMRRLLTGYAINFNKRHKRSGHLFQNRYKSVLCDEEQHLLQLVQYIHLIPLRDKLVKTIKSLKVSGVNP